MRSISRDTSWTHALAVRRAQEHFLHIRQGHDAGKVDLDRFFLQVSEFLFWVCIADEGFKLVLQGDVSPNGLSYPALRSTSIDGQHVMAARWARNKITHCLARPVVDDAGRLDEFVLNESTLGPDLRWLASEAAIKDAVEAEQHPGGRLEYDEHFANRLVYSTLLPCYRWISEVRYVYHDAEYAANWFRHQGRPSD